VNNPVDNFEELLEEYFLEAVDNTVDKSFFYGDLILQAIVDNAVDNCDLPGNLILAAEEELMWSIAYKRAGNLVQWTAGGETPH
jgi:hypothetical protein